ncbi:VOC family protein [Prosthecomicrobium sp. N25]|uniref:VOC family protein n=1 Tax=Prosthecomicrobium sp. N25 TaxID=3129254 RepID=UPI003077F899
MSIDPSASVVAPAALPAASHVGPVTLAVRDLPGLVRWYRTVLGMQVLLERPDKAVLGAADGRALLVLQGRPDLPADDPRRAGLFHVAYLMPSRRELARWVAHVAARRIAIEGASDHLVSEAFYLSDPEGNGIEVYRDRTRPEWPHEAGRLKIDTLPADIRGILAEGTAAPAFEGLPAGTTVGHVHLKVADIADSRRFYVDALGLEPMVETYPGALFVAAGGYHHHLGLNTWQSRGRPRPAPTLGLAAATLVLGDTRAVAAALARLAAAGYETDGDCVLDPSGNRIRLLAAEPTPEAAVA